ncbi:RHS repeat-associated core domain-containing protein, partial [Elizabethkingia anophelis]|uniref:RHS repeat-associated core domain-containing protein n=3 Tax=Elizabethkingia anophelis TaxID=1117645 RepID=UPI0021A35A63
DPLAYGEKTLENSPLDRVLAQAAPGSDWDGKKVQYQYQANADGEVYRYTTSTSWSNNATVSVLGLSGTYGASSLYKNVVTDEDGNSTIEFKNGQGQIVLVRKKNGSEDLDTYYVYNEYNQLAFVIPPLAVHKGVDLALLNELAYQYRYDGQNKLVEKKLPGKDWEYMVYDQQDRLVLTQDGKLRQLNKWLFTKYDKFGRVAYTGVLDSAPGRDAQQSNMVHFGGNNEERSASGFTQNGTTVYYSSSAYPVGNFTLLTVNYYDEYPPGSPAVFNGASVLGSNPVNGRSTKGLPVASMVKNIEDNGCTKSYTWYDDKARPVATESQNHLGGYTRTSSVLAFSGVPTSTTIYHKRDAASGEMVMKEDFSYDHQNRLVKHTHQVNGGLVEVLAENIYNELGQLESRNIGNGIQSIKNEYNIRGALTKMNDPRNLMNKLFGFELKYINPSGTSKKYNGNIAETDWATQSDGTLRRYSYQYDGVNRLKEGNYWDNAGAISGSYAERLNYDVNGNITGLQRTGLGAGVMDQLGYTYDQSGNSNKLIRVNDASGNAAGYPVGGNTIGYDINGNMVNHLDKGISNIAYNYLNLPSSITASIGNTDYVYRADGTKVRKVFGGKTTDYLDGFQYENGVLQFVPTSEGYYDVVKNKYIYNYTDHLGNVRLSYTKGASGGAEIIEENNYYPFGLKHQGYNSNSLANNAYQYKYNGKELQETGMYDYDARMYMPELGRWGVVDPLAEKMTRYSPYNYAFNNPIRFIDPDGNAPNDIIFRGTDKKEIRILAKGPDKIINVPFALHENTLRDIGIKNVDPGRLAIGYTVQADAAFSAAIGGNIGLEASVVQFTDSKYSNYNYVYAGTHEGLSGGAQAGGSISAGGSVFVAYNNDSQPLDPKSFQGNTVSVGASADIKAIVGGGVNINYFSGTGYLGGKGNEGWKGVSIGANIGIGFGANAGSINGTLSKTLLVNDMKETSKRSLIDRVTNAINPIASAIATGAMARIRN